MRASRNDPHNLATVSHIVIGETKLAVLMRGSNSVTVEIDDNFILPMGSVVGPFRARNGKRLANIPVAGCVLLRETFTQSAT